MPIRETFHKFSNAIADAMGTPVAFFMAFMVLAVWGATGPFEGYSDTWQLIINTATTIILSWCSLFRTRARNSFIDLEHLTDEELDRLQKHFEQVRHKREEGGEGEKEPRLDDSHSPP